MNFTEEYYPDLNELTPEALEESRAHVVRILQPAMPDVDLSPGTPTGDLIVTALAAFWAAAGEANNRLISDLDLGNVANGIIYSCNFVRAYLGNFSVYDVKNLQSAGLVRLTFDSPLARVVQRSTRYRFGNTDDYSLHVADTESTYISILAAGSIHTGAVDTYVLTQTSSVTWAVDLPVTGVMTAAVARGASGTSTDVDAALVGISAATDFLAGVTTASLPELAKLARMTAYSLTAGSRASTRTAVLRHWPETVMVSPVVTGDPEMLRSTAGAAMILQQPAMDVYVRSTRDMQREAQIIRLEYVTAPSGPTSTPIAVFRGRVKFLHVPSRIVSVEWAGSSAVSGVERFTLFTHPSKAGFAGSTYCQSRYEEFALEVVPAIVDGASVITRSEVIEDNVVTSQYAMFTVTYDTDPLVDTMAATLEAPDHKPPGTDVLVKAGPLVELSNLTISYSKKQGTRVTLSAARARIAEYLRLAGYPDVFRQTELHDIMRDSGANRVTDITCAGAITVTAATRRSSLGTVDPYVADPVGDWYVDSTVVDPIVVTSVSQIVPSTIVNGEVGGFSELWAATGRTARYYIDPENIDFVEVT